MNTLGPDWEPLSSGSRKHYPGIKVPAESGLRILWVDTSYKGGIMKKEHELKLPYNFKIPEYMNLLQHASKSKRVLFMYPRRAGRKTFHAIFSEHRPGKAYEVLDAKRIRKAVKFLEDGTESNLKEDFCGFVNKKRGKVMGTRLISLREELNKTKLLLLLKMQEAIKDNKFDRVTAIAHTLSNLDRI